MANYIDQLIEQAKAIGVEYRYDHGNREGQYVLTYDNREWRRSDLGGIQGLLEAFIHYHEKGQPIPPNTGKPLATIPT